MTIFTIPERQKIKVAFRYLTRGRLILAAIFFIEIALSGVLVLTLPKTIFLHWYLNDTQINSTDKFIKGESIIIEPSKDLGWRNQSNYVYGKWEIDEIGSRSTTKKMISTQKIKPIRAIFFGSSTIVGMTTITNDETISAFTEDVNIETLNYGTWMYSLDQILLQLIRVIHSVDANVVVIGMNALLDGSLENQYIPFLFHSELEMPLLKPRYRLVNDKLIAIRVNPEKMLKEILENDKALDFIEQNDEYFTNFRLYQWMGLFPVSQLVKRLIEKLDKGMTPYFDKHSESNLRRKIIKKIIEESKRYEIPVIFAIFTDRYIYFRSGRRKYLPDLYKKNMDELKKLKINIVDTRDILKKYNSEKNFYRDSSHLTPEGNKIIAEHIKKEIYRILK